ncbi:MAG: DUF1634 domain-containing protein [Thermoplasmatales archaeon]
MAHLNVRKIIRKFLLYGVSAGFAFVIIGMALSFVIDWSISSRFSSILSMARMNSSLTTFTSMIDVTRDLPLALMSIGIMILVFVPVGRGMLTVFMFLNEDDRLYAIICSLVVLIVLISFLVVGPFIRQLGW